MLFAILKFPARLALWIYCKSIRINKKEMLDSKGPLLIAANHPNSFLDAIILATIFKKPIYSLARGDAFSGGFISRLLYAMNILPVYRISEGAENLNSNYDTFSKCKEIFMKGGIVLIFSEGLCINEWKLRALKKGTARLTLDSWQEGIDLQVLPTGINYHSFFSFGKHVHINFGNIITRNDFSHPKLNGFYVNDFNTKLKNELLALVDHYDEDKKEEIKEKYVIDAKPVQQYILSIPAFFGKWIHAPLYIPVRHISLKKAAPFCHHDSVVVGLLFILYPAYLLLIASLISAAFGHWFGLAILVALPVMAWAFVKTKKD